MRREREKKRERKRSLIIISLIALYGSLNALGSHSGFLILLRQSVGPERLCFRTKSFLVNYRSTGEIPHFLLPSTFMESVKLKVTGVEVRTPQILVSDML